MLNYVLRHEDVRGIGDVVPCIPKLGTRWKLVIFTPLPILPPGKELPGFRWLGGWVGSRAGLDAVAKRKEILSLLLPGIEPRSSSL